MADVADLKSAAFWRAGSTPAIPTMKIIIDRQLLSYTNNPRYEIKVLNNEVVVYDLWDQDGPDKLIVHRLYIGENQCDSTDGLYLD